MYTESKKTEILNDLKLWADSELMGAKERFADAGFTEQLALVQTEINRRYEDGMQNDTAA